MRVLLTSLATLCLLSTFFVIALSQNSQTARAGGTIYIRANGLVEGTDKIASTNNIAYSFTGNINDSLSLVRKYFPVYNFSAGEKWFPCSFYFDNDTDLYNKDSYDSQKPLPPHYAYIHITENTTHKTIQHWLYSVWNYHEVWPDHDSDWDSTLFLTLEKMNGTFVPVDVCYFFHQAKEHRSWSDWPEKENNTHPVVYVANGSHGAYSSPEEMISNPKNYYVNDSWYPGGTVLRREDFNWYLVGDNVNHEHDLSGKYCNIVVEWIEGEPQWEFEEDHWWPREFPQYPVQSMDPPWHRLDWMKAAPAIHQGDLVLHGNNVTTIEGRLDINGSIIVEDNATLHLKNAFLNFTQTRNRQYNVTLSNPLNGNPRLSAYNSTITSNFQIYADLKDNSTGIIENSTISCYVQMWGYSSLSVSSSSYAYYIKPLDSSATSIDDSLVGTIESYSLAEVHVNASEINLLHIVPRSINCTISKLEPGLISYWDFINNCSVTVLHDGTTPNVTLTNTWVHNLGFAFQDNSDAVIINSTVWEASASDYSIIHMRSTDCYWASAGLSTVLSITDSSLDTLYVFSSSNTWLLNSTFSTLYKFDSAKVHVTWYLNAHVVDSIGQDVPSANVTATYPNATVAESKLTDANGWARLTLMEKMMNATGEYPVGNYTVEAVYSIHKNETAVNMTENKQVTLILDNFLIPEFPSFIIFPLFMMATLVAAIAYKGKRFTMHANFYSRPCWRCIRKQPPKVFKGEMHKATWGSVASESCCELL